MNKTTKTTNNRFSTEAIKSFLAKTEKHMLPVNKTESYSVKLKAI